MEKFDIQTASRSNWVAMRQVLSACALEPDEQLVREDLDELFVFEGVRGVKWMFAELGWLSADSERDLERFEEAAIAIFDLGDRAYDDDVVRTSGEWRALRSAARACLMSMADRPWVAGA